MSIFAASRDVIIMLKREEFVIRMAQTRKQCSFEGCTKSSKEGRSLYYAWSEGDA